MIRGNLKIIAMVAGVLSVFFYWQNNDITVNEIDFKSNKVPKSFDGYRILHVSDLHNKRFGKGQRKLVEVTNEINPDVIVITGDLIDSRRTNVDKALEYIDKAIKVAPVYYVPGNHESRVDEYLVLKEGLFKSGVKILDNKIKEININNEKISLIGIVDPTLLKSNDKIKEFENTLSNLKESTNGNLNILLSHRPELLNVYARQEMDLVFTGHAHGGQIRLPFTQGLFAPAQGLLPKYTSGIHNDSDTQMIVSRGLGNSLFPFRIFNRPELVITTLNS